MNSLSKIKQWSAVYALVIGVTLFGSWLKADRISYCNLNIEKITNHLTPSFGTETLQTMYYAEHTKTGQIRFRKDPKALWASAKHLRSDGQTPQGDVRNPIFLFGPELALKLGFSIDNDYSNTYFSAPDAELLKTKIEIINKYLKSKNKDPIAYLPSRAPFLNDKELFNFTLDTKTNSDFLINFPYADLDPLLVVHEISFHFGALLFPSKLFARVRQVHLHVRNLASLLESTKLPNLVQLARFLVKKRNSDLDVGTGNLQLKLADARVLDDDGKNSFMSYREIKSIFFTNPLTAHIIDELGTHIDDLANPSMRPIDAVLDRIKKITGVSQPPWYKAPFLFSKSEKMLLKNIMKNYYDSHKNDDGDVELKTSKQWLAELLAGLDERIKDFNDALSVP